MRTNNLETNSQTVSNSSSTFAGRAAFRANVRKHNRANRIYNRLHCRIEHYGVTLELDHAHNVCICGQLPSVDYRAMHRYLQFEHISVIETMLWDNGEFMLILK